jgi:hypothetical protein
MPGQGRPIEVLPPPHQVAQSFAVPPFWAAFAPAEKVARDNSPTAKYERSKGDSLFLRWPRTTAPVSGRELLRNQSIQS